jgi:glutaconyl-CoA decarboxylase
LATHRFVIGEKTYEVAVGDRSGNTVEVTVNGKSYTVELSGPAAASAPPAQTAPNPAPAAVATPAAATGPAPVATGASGEVRAPISGIVLRVEVSPGQSVTAGALLLVLEAMKMENEMFAPIDGTVTSVDVSAQQDVRQGDLLLTITPG